jgi:hypothetical protein
MLNLNVINTPDRRKSQQLCHANMLKQYFERYSSTTDVVSLVTPLTVSIVYVLNCLNVPISNPNLQESRIF